VLFFGAEWLGARSNGESLVEKASFQKAAFSGYWPSFSTAACSATSLSVRELQLAQASEQSGPWGSSSPRHKEVTSTLKGALYVRFRALGFSNGRSPAARHARPKRLSREQESRRASCWQATALGTKDWDSRKLQSPH